MDSIRHMRRVGSILMPASMLCSVIQPSRRDPKPTLQIDCTPQALCLLPMGAWDAEMLLEGLPNALRVLDGYCRNLQLVLSKLKRFDDLDLSALLVLLRKYAGCFKSILLSGLPSWASTRIQRTDDGNLLGYGWTLKLTQETARFQKRA